MSKVKDYQVLLRMYRNSTGKAEVVVEDVARWAIERNLVIPPTPKTVEEIVARDIARAARQERRTDAQTGRPYRAWQTFPQARRGGKQLTLWIDIDDASRKHMVKAVAHRRTQILNDCVMLSHDAEHWNRVNPDEEQLEIDFDLNLEVEVEKSARDEEREGEAA